MGIASLICRHANYRNNSDNVVTLLFDNFELSPGIDLYVYELYIINIQVCAAYRNNSDNMVTLQL